MVGRDPPAERSPAALLEFGVVNLDKPPGPSAHQVTGWVRDVAGDALGEQWPDGDREIGRAAHAGTLDPKVTGCLPILTDDAVRLARVFDESVKEYVAVLELHGPAPADVEAVVAEFEGEIYQKPPRKSAVVRTLRTRTIHDLSIRELDGRRALLRIRCDAGTYVRKLCHDIGLALGTGAHMGDLRRTATGTFDDTDLVTMEELVDALAFWVEDGDEERLREVVQPAERALSHLPRIVVAESAAEEIAHGAPLYGPGALGTEPAPDDGADPEEGDLVVCVTLNGAAVCLGTLVGDPDAESGIVVDLERVLV